MADPRIEFADTTDVYVFARETDPDLMGKIARDPSGVVRFVATITGDYSSLAVIESDGPDLQRVARDLYAPSAEAPASDPDTSKPIAFGMFSVKRSIWLAESAFMRIGVQPNMAAEVLEVANDLAGYSASAIVLGNYDILLELGAENRPELYRRIAAATRMPGVAWSRTHLVLDWWHRDHPKET
jgi:hypothetical protein